MNRTHFKAYVGYSWRFDNSDSRPKLSPVFGLMLCMTYFSLLFAWGYQMPFCNCPSSYFTRKRTHSKCVPLGVGSQRICTSWTFSVLRGEDPRNSISLLCKVWILGCPLTLTWTDSVRRFDCNIRQGWQDSSKIPYNGKVKNNFKKQLLRNNHFNYLHAVVNIQTRLSRAQ